MGLITVTATLLTAGVALNASAVPASSSSGPPGSAKPPPDPPALAMGAYLHYGPAGVERMQHLSSWLGGSPLRVGHTYLPGDVWSNIEGSPAFLRAWANWKRGGPHRMFVLNVPMLERNEERVPDQEVRQLLRAGAQGSFDQHFRRLAQRLVRLGVPDTVIVLGWEMNGITYTHRCGPDPEAWKAYWNRIVTAMRSVPGQDFTFDFAPNRGPDAVPWTQCYPGDSVVDVIGLDSYDQPPGESFEEQVRGPYGLQHQVDFAKAHGKAISYPEWGLFRNGDNPEYMRGMLDWFEQHKPLYQTISDYCPHGVWQCDANPESSKVFRSRLFGLGRPDENEPTTPTTPAKPTNPPTANPTPTSKPTPTPKPKPKPTDPDEDSTPTQPPSPPPSKPTPPSTTPPPSRMPEPTTPPRPTPTDPPGKPEPSPTPEPPRPSAPTVNSDNWCVPHGLGDWVKKWMGDGADWCVRRDSRTGWRWEWRRTDRPY
ncbi:glycoside hydrolase family 26 protein [Streptomyces sp. LHD-70]|uniref:glycoside hydrolase family 26 protein n=1 Tax=Streptomyces sp. LHD-70 TaxID=3072140 RepID=UPI0035BE127D